MTGNLSPNEKRLLAALAPVKEADASLLAERLGATEEAIVQHAHLCSDRGLCKLERHVARRYELTPE